MTAGVTYAVAGDAGVITLSQPDKKNAVSAAMWAALPGAVKEADADARAKVIIVTGAGNAFAAGADISEFEDVYRTPQSAADYTHTMLSGLKVLETSTKPTIARIRGACVGGGVSIALACDFRFADDSARLGITPSKLGLVYSADDTRRLAAAVGAGAAKRLLMTADIIDAAEAKAVGLVDDVAAAGALDQAVDAFVAAIADKSQWSVRATKSMFRLLSDDSDGEAMALMLGGFAGPDFREGYRAFLDKRRPDFPVK
ncbi:MAG: enoyl-CoA hydratase-related protein [Pseudomonadota bacterium]